MWSYRLVHTPAPSRTRRSGRGRGACVRLVLSFSSHSPCLSFSSPTFYEYRASKGFSPPSHSTPPHPTSRLSARIGCRVGRASERADERWIYCHAPNQVPGPGTHCRPDAIDWRVASSLLVVDSLRRRHRRRHHRRAQVRCSILKCLHDASVTLQCDAATTQSRSGERGPGTLLCHHHQLSLSRRRVNINRCGCGCGCGWGAWRFNVAT